MNKKKINWGYFGSLILSVVLALVVGAAIMAATGYDPLNAYHELFRGATGCDNLGQVFTGLFTGLCAQFLIARLERISRGKDPGTKED